MGDVSLTMTGEQYATLHAHLYPGDGLEASAILLCGSRAGARHHRLVVNQVHPIPYTSCKVRTSTQLIWDTEQITTLLENARRQKWTVVKVHSHPTGYPTFSSTDDIGDAQLLSAIQDWVEEDLFHSSAVMLPDGKMFGRFISSDQQLLPLSKISVVGDNLVYWTDSGDIHMPEFATSHIQAFGDGTFELLKNLSIAIIGCSGTGSPVIEQLARLGVGELLLVDNDIIEERNLNRIINSTAADAQNSRRKVDVLGDAVERMGLGTNVLRLPHSLWDPEVVKAVAECDVIFGCVDTIDGRYLINVISTYYAIPYFDIGVRLIANPVDENHFEITEVCGSVHYLKPGFSLMSRNVFSMEMVRAAGLARNDPEAFSKQVKEGYIRGVIVNRPAVVSLNMTLASLGVHELLARLHPFREERNDTYDHIEVSLVSMDIFKDRKPNICSILGNDIGKGDQTPLLEMPELSKRPASI